MQLNWHVICSEKSLSRIKGFFQGKDLKICPYWKDSMCLEMSCADESDAEEVALVMLCRQISGTEQVQVDRQPTGVEYACYVTLEEIKNGGKAFVVCFMNIKENE